MQQHVYCRRCSRDRRIEGFREFRRFFYRNAPAWLRWTDLSLPRSKRNCGCVLMEWETKCDSWHRERSPSNKLCVSMKSHALDMSLCISLLCELGIFCGYVHTIMTWTEVLWSSVHRAVSASVHSRPLTRLISQLARDIHSSIADVVQIEAHGMRNDFDS